MTADVLTPPNSSKLLAAVPVKAMAASAHAVQTQAHGPHQGTTAIRRDEKPPRNDQDEYYCAHPECQGKTVTFRRICEWNKHMDRHERPYKCDHPNCQNSQGFTYSGGLLRHQREVHRWHQTTKSRIFCPFPDCSRNSTGEGFSRRENLEEHKRRRHPDQSDPVSSDATDAMTASTRESANPKKCKRLVTPLPSESSVPPETPDHSNLDEPTSPHYPDNSLITTITPHDEGPLVKKLRTELQHMSDLNFQLRNENDVLRRQVAQYYNFVQHFPPQSYAVAGGGASVSHGQAGVEMLSPRLPQHQHHGVMGYGGAGIMGGGVQGYKK